RIWGSSKRACGIILYTRECTNQTSLSAFVARMNRHREAAADPGAWDFAGIQSAMDGVGGAVRDRRSLNSPAQLPDHRSHLVGRHLPSPASHARSNIP